MISPRRIVLTGASSGIGRALALELARDGSSMLLVARRATLLEELARELEQQGVRAIPLPLDITDPDASERIVRSATEELGGIDLLVLNAGRGGPVWIDELDAGEIERVTEVNYLAPARLTAAVLPSMLERGSGTIVAISSLAAYRGMPGSGPYNASKAALTTFMESLRTEARQRGVTISTIAPGFVRTTMTDQNEFRMPVLLEPDDAARRIVRAIDAGRSLYRFPFSISLAVRLLQWLPNPLFDRLVAWGRADLLSR